MATLKSLLSHRFGEALADDGLAGNAVLEGIARRGSCRAYRSTSVPVDLIRTLSAVALSAPTKSDLQQRDIVIVTDPDVRARINDLLGEAWIATAPAFLVFCGNHRRQRLIHDWRGRPFANDHFDAFWGNNAS